MLLLALPFSTSEKPDPTFENVTSSADAAAVPEGVHKGATKPAISRQQAHNQRIASLAQALVGAAQTLMSRRRESSRCVFSCGAISAQKVASVVICAAHCFPTLLVPFSLQSHEYTSGSC
jgi:hypothetical protein